MIIVECWPYCIVKLTTFYSQRTCCSSCLMSSIGADHVVKIGGFGLAKYLHSQDYYY